MPVDGPGIVVHPDGRVVVLMAMMLDEDDWEFILHGFVFSADLQLQAIIEGEPTTNLEGMPGGLVLADNAEYAYGFITNRRIQQGEWAAETKLFRFSTDADVLAANEGDAWEGLNISIDGAVESVALARGYLWVVGETGAIQQIMGASGPDYVDPPLIKRADKPAAQIGDVITYTITFDNTKLPPDEEQPEIVDQNNVWIQDVLPPGFVFVEGSSYVHPSGVGGAAPVPLPPAVSSSGRTLQFMLAEPTDPASAILRDTMRSLTYQVVVGPRVVEGATYTNEAIGYADGANTTPGWLDFDKLCPDGNQVTPDCDFILTNVARADVRIVPGVFTPQGIVVGKVFHDLDGDGVQTADEPGVAGARIFMETGVSVVTDAFGKFSLSNLTPGLHVFMLDESSLRTENGRLRAGPDGPFRLLDLTGGGLFTVNFPVQD